MPEYCQYCGSEGSLVCVACEPRRALDRELVWKKLCPPAFLGTDISKLPCPAPARRALAHDFRLKGLVLHGTTGTGKTRVAWLLVKQQVLTGHRVRVLSTLSALDYASQFAAGSSSVKNWVTGLVNCDLLMLDDVFKNKLTDAFESMVFAVVDKRAEQNRPVLVTSNDTGASLAERLSGDRGVPLVRRLREFCEAIHFK